jgi:hypothetical protein
MLWAMVVVGIGRFGRTHPLMVGLGTAWPLPPVSLSSPGGFDGVRDALSARRILSNRSINSGLVSRSSSSRFMDGVNHNTHALARARVITGNLPRVTISMMDVTLFAR